MRLTIPDAIVEQYQQLAEATGQPVERLILTNLEKFATLSPTVPSLTLDGPTLDALADRLRGGSITSAADLLAKLDRLASIQFGEIRLNFSPGQLEELATRATRQGRPVEALVVATIRGMERDFFTRLDGGTVTGKRTKPVGKAAASLPPPSPGPARTVPTPPPSASPFRPHPPKTFPTIPVDPSPTRTLPPAEALPHADA